MKKALLAGVAAVMVSAVPSLADGTLFATIDLDKDVYVAEYFTLYNTVNIQVRVDLELDKAAESIALLNQRNQDNLDDSYYTHRSDSMYESGNNNTGAISINQASGNMNNQGTVVALAIDGGQYDEEDYGFAEANASAEQINTWNRVFSFATSRSASISWSLNGNHGIVHANQATGSFANQANVLSIALSDSADGGVAMSEADLGQFNTMNYVSESEQARCGCGYGSGQTRRTASIDSSLNYNTGIFGANQSAGNMSNQANVVAISAVGDF